MRDPETGMLKQQLAALDRWMTVLPERTRRYRELVRESGVATPFTARFEGPPTQGPRKL